VKVFSNQQLPVYQVIGQTLRVHWDFEEQSILRPDETEEAIFACKEAICDKSDDRNTLIEKIMASEYTTGAELAAINNGGEDYETYQAFRQHAKDLANGWIAQR
jgi:hypothetical protein